MGPLQLQFMMPDDTEARDGNPSEQYALPGGSEAQALDPSFEERGDVIAVHREIADRHRLDEVRALHHDADDQRGLGDTLVKRPVVDAENVRAVR